MTEGLGRVCLGTAPAPVPFLLAVPEPTTIDGLHKIQTLWDVVLLSVTPSGFRVAGCGTRAISAQTRRLEITTGT